MKWFLFCPVFLFAINCVDENVNPARQVRNNFEVINPEVDGSTAVDPCDVTNPTEGLFFCDCFPDCCQTQEWFCAPRLGEPSLSKRTVVVNYCTESIIPCISNFQSDCPPPIIVAESECYQAYECPPNSVSLDYGWQSCTMPDGSKGKMQVFCNKGNLLFSDCQGCKEEICDNADNDCDGLTDEDLNLGECFTSCGPGTSVCLAGDLVCLGPEPGEEICDYKDNDCDGEIDEGQRNACDECGLVDPEACDGIDNNCDGQTDEGLIQECSTTCGTGIAYCSSGVWAGCTAKQPDTEICNGLDDDCDGFIDEDLECLCTMADVGMLMPCFEEPLKCGKGYKSCYCTDLSCEDIQLSECLAVCHWFAEPEGSDPNCDPTIGMPIDKEHCNNFDDNCNELIDENLTMECYSGPPDTVGNAKCMSGDMVCEKGEWGSFIEPEGFIEDLCMGEVVPTMEVCNGLDDDCDGVIDWGEEPKQTDVLFIVDLSGSMYQEINAVLTSIVLFASEYALENEIHWGLVTTPQWKNNKDLLVLNSDITKIENFLNVFGGIVFSSEGYKESMLDAAYLSIQNLLTASIVDITQSEWSVYTDSIPNLQDFSISWRPDSEKIVIMFSDEAPQSYLIPGIDIDTVRQACQSADKLTLHVFSTLSSWWKNLPHDCGGKHFSLKSSTTETYASLMEVLDKICK
jgi:hypothetical protein